MLRRQRQAQSKYKHPSPDDETISDFSKRRLDVCIAYICCEDRAPSACTATVNELYSDECHRIKRVPGHSMV